MNIHNYELYIWNDLNYPVQLFTKVLFSLSYEITCRHRTIWNYFTETSMTQ